MNKVIIFFQNVTKYVRNDGSRCHFFIIKNKSFDSVFFSPFVSQEFGRNQPTARTSTPRAARTLPLCWPLPMTLAKCTCSPSPVLNQGWASLNFQSKSLQRRAAAPFSSNLLMNFYCESLAEKTFHFCCFHSHIHSLLL